MKIAVTGGTGFLGRYILRELAKEGHELRAWKRSTSDISGLDDLSVEWVEGGLRSPESIEPLIKGVDAVVHAALERPRGWNFRQSGNENLHDFAMTNLIGSLDLMAHSSGQVDRFIFISTCAVHEVILDDRSLDETHPVWPTSHYGAHKAALEAFVSSFGHGQNLPICALRPCGIYGVAHPVSDSKYYDLVGEVIANRKIESGRGGKEVHAADVAKAVGLLLQAPAEAITGQAFNCCDGYVSEEHVAEIAKEISGSKSEIQRSNRGPKHQIDTTKIRKLGMQFGGEGLLRQTIEQLVRAHLS